MSHLSVYPDTPAVASGRAPLALAEGNDPAWIRRMLAGNGIEFARWPLPGGLPDAPALLPDALAPLLAPLRARYPTVDAVKMSPDHPQRLLLRQKFLAEHRHSEDEVRLFVAGGGLFCFHLGARVFVLRAAGGDFIAVPAGTPHWFDAGEAPDFAAIRLFTDPAGWVAQYTGSDISARFPAYKHG